MIDLHTHSTASDGACSPAQLIEKAHLAGLSAIALTDHDVVNGCPEFQTAALKYPDLKAINGAELGVDHPANMEILALCIGDLAPYLERQKRLVEIRDEANRARLSLLQKAGYRIEWRDVAYDEKGAARKIIAKPHIVQFLLKTGQIPNSDFGYKSLLAKGSPAYVKKNDPSVADTIDFIRQTGAVAVLAHPCLIRLTGQDLFNEVARLKQMGLQGVEVYHSDCTEAQTEEYREMALALGLVMSGGSDYHGGAAHAGVELGVGRGNLNIPDEMLGAIERLSHHRSSTFLSQVNSRQKE